MTWITADLTQRVQILIGRLEPNEAGGGDFLFGNELGDAFARNEYNQLAPVKTIWMSLNPITFQGRGSSYIRGEQINESVTHKLKCRKIAVSDLGKEFGSGYSGAFKFMPNLMNLKSDYFLFVQRASNVKGRLFRIHNVIDNKEQREYLNVFAEEIEERGVGWPA